LKEGLGRIFGGIEELGKAATWLRGALILYFLYVVFRLRLWRIVIPSFVRRELPTLKALRMRPLYGAPWADATGPEGVPNRSASWCAFPSVLGGGTPTARRTEDLSLVFHGAIFTSIGPGAWIVGRSALV